MRKLISSAVLAVICAAAAPSAAEAQSRSAIPELAPAQAAAAHATVGAGAEAHDDYFSAAALRTFHAGRRSPLLFPAVGALVGAAGVTGVIAYECSGSGECIFNPVVPLVAGAVLGAAVGGIVELGLRAAGR